MQIATAETRAETTGQENAGVTAGAVIALCIVGGAALRLIFPRDIEYKYDEEWLFSHALALAAGGAWPWSGPLTSDTTTPHGPLSVWVLAALASLRGATTPPQLAQAVQIANVIAIGVFCGFVFACIQRDRREPWLWAAALWAVDPIAIILERKIWLPSLLPPLAVLFYATWWLRRAPAAAFAWGALGAMMPQIHVGAAFLVIALAAWTLAFDRAAFPWKSWLAGSIAGTLPALPWLMELWRISSQSAELPARLRFVNGTYLLRWVTQPFGMGIGFVLDEDYLDFLAAPQIAGVPSYLIGGIHVVLIALMLAVLARATIAIGRSGILPTENQPSANQLTANRLAANRLAANRLAATWQAARSIFLGSEPTAVLINAGLWGYGLLLTLLTIGRTDMHRHYLLVVMPLMALWCARLVFSGGGARWRPRAVLATLCVLQLALSAALLLFIHDRQVIRGEFGATWNVQQK